MVQWLRLHASNAGGTDSIPGQGTKIPQAAQHGQKTLKITKRFFFFFLFLNLFIYLFYLWLCWVFVSVRGLSLVAASGGHSSLFIAVCGPSHYRGLSCCGAQAPDAQAQ